MAERGFSLEAVLSFREAELEMIERDLSRLVLERQTEKEKSQEMQRRKEKGLESMGGAAGPETGFLLASYAWLEHMEELLGAQKRREESLEEEYERVRQAWRKARMEKEKIVLLKEKFQGQERRKTLLKEERFLEFWAQSRDMGAKNTRKGEG